ncbi:MAG: hypothetical protein ACUVR8_04440 [Acidobacteriota bacterium]
MMDAKQVRQSLLKDRAVEDAIRRRAHQISIERGYSTPQHMAEDWFRAENEVLEKLVEEEIKRRQKMNAAISEGAMAEEAIPAVVLPPSLTESLNKSTGAVKKSGPGRKKTAAATIENTLSTTLVTSASKATAALPTTRPAAEEVTPNQPKRKRKSSTAVMAADKTVPPLPPDPAPATPASKSKAAKPAKSQTGKKKST